MSWKNASRSGSGSAARRAFVWSYSARSVASRRAASSPHPVFTEGVGQDLSLIEDHLLEQPDACAHLLVLREHLVVVDRCGEEPAVVDAAHSDGPADLVAAVLLDAAAPVL